MQSFTKKNRLCEMNARECDIKEDFKQNGCRYSPYEEKMLNISFSSCSFLFLKTLFYFKWQCISLPYLDSDLCILGNELDCCNIILA